MPISNCHDMEPSPAEPISWPRCRNTLHPTRQNVVNVVVQSIALLRCRRCQACLLEARLGRKRSLPNSSLPLPAGDSAIAESPASVQHRWFSGRSAFHEENHPSSLINLEPRLLSAYRRHLHSPMFHVTLRAVLRRGGLPPSYLLQLVKHSACCTS